MKTKFNYALLLTFFALLTFSSCQDEVLEITETNEEQVLAANSELASLMKSTSSNSGSTNDIVLSSFRNDDTNCLSVNLPVTIIVNGITITIDTQEDLELIEDIYEEFNDDEDVLEFIFPITIILNDYTEVVIENLDQLENFIERCNNDDDVINCVDFHYPISFSIFNTEFQIIDTIVIENDRELYHFLERINDANEPLLASLNFPVKLVYANGETVEVHNNQELERAINEADGFCDDEHDRCDIEVVDEELIECHWKIYYYNDDDHFRPFDIFFLENGELNIVNENATVAITGEWDTTETDDGIVLSISNLSQFNEELSGEWLIVECDDDRFRVVRRADAAGTTDTKIVLKRRCNEEPECSAQEIRMGLSECRWYSVSNVYDNNGLGVFHFGADGSVYVDLPNGNEITGTWEVALTDYGVKIILDLPEPYSDLTRYWKVIECDERRIKAVHEDLFIVFERECETNPFECYSDTELVICDDDNIDGLAEFNLEMLYPNCVTDDVEVSYHNTLADAKTGLNGLGSTYVNTTNPETIYVRVLRAGSNDDYEVFEAALYVEDCSPGCTEEEVDSYLIEDTCYWGPVSINNSDDFSDYQFHFNENQELVIEGNGTNITATWSTSQGSGNGVVLDISQIDGNLEIFNGQWTLTYCSVERLDFVFDGIELKLYLKC